jgi:hypothetical protein
MPSPIVFYETQLCTLCNDCITVLVRILVNVFARKENKLFKAKGSRIEMSETNTTVFNMMYLIAVTYLLQYT